MACTHTILPAGVVVRLCCCAGALTFWEACGCTVLWFAFGLGWCVVLELLKCGVSEGFLRHDNAAVAVDRQKDGQQASQQGGEQETGPSIGGGGKQGALNWRLLRVGHGIWPSSDSRGAHLAVSTFFLLLLPNPPAPRACTTTALFPRRLRLLCCCCCRLLSDCGCLRSMVLLGCCAELEKLVGLLLRRVCMCGVCGAWGAGADWMHKRRLRRVKYAFRHANAQLKQQNCSGCTKPRGR